MDLTVIRKRLENRYNGQDMSVAEEGYKDFLYKIKYGYEVTPNPLVDLMWHEHILDTKKYAKDCQQFLGRFLHHTPQGGFCAGDMGE